MADQSTLSSQNDDSENVSVNSLHDVMAVMTRRLQQLLVRQDERRAKLFAELFSDDVVDLSGRLGNVTEQTVALGVEISTRNTEVDGRRKHDPEELPRTECRDSVADGKAPTATQDTMEKERRTDGMSELQCGPVNPEEGLKSDLQLESCTFAVRYTPGVRAVKGVATDDSGDDIPMLVEEMVDRFCDKAGHHYVGCRHRRDRQYRRSKAVTYSPCRRSVGIG